MKKEKITRLKCADIEITIANYFKPRIHMIVPNISWGMGVHECDMLIINGSGYGVEIEIKVSRADVKKDLKKGHGHRSDKIRRLYFAIPDYLCVDEVIAMIPERAGIIMVRPGEAIDYVENAGKTKGVYYSKPKCVVVRNAKINKNAKPFNDGQRANMGRLGMLRYWSIRNNNWTCK